MKTEPSFSFRSVLRAAGRQVNDLYYVDRADRIWGDAEAIGHTLDHAYAHHIERLMILGLFACSLAFGHITYIAGAFSRLA